MENGKPLPDYFLKLCQSVTAKRPKVVIDHILEYGFITTEDIKERYGYNHPPRAARDVRELGIPLETFRVTSRDGRKIAAYRFGDITKVRFSKASGRTGLSKQIKEALIEQYGCQCFIYLEEVEERELQIDHRIPFEVGGEPELDADNFMLLCGSANRAKSWSCQQCNNWKNLKDSSICASCYWAFPEEYEHIAMQPIRRIDLLWRGEDIETYEHLRERAITMNKSLANLVKDIIKQALENPDSL